MKLQVEVMITLASALTRSLMQLCLRIAVWSQTFPTSHLVKCIRKSLAKYVLSLLQTKARQHKRGIVLIQEKYCQVLDVLHHAVKQIKYASTHYRQHSFSVLR